MKWIDEELFEQCQRYYANILTPSAAGNAENYEMLGFDLPSI